MVLNHADTDDVVQEVFVRVVKGLATFRQESQFSTWLQRVTMNTVYRFLKQRNRRPLPGTEASPAVEAPSDCEPEHVALHAELDEVIGRALEQLAPAFRGAFVLTVLDGVPPNEVAAIEGCSRATVYWRVHRARRTLKKLLKEWM